MIFFSFFSCLYIIKFDTHHIVTWADFINNWILECNALYFFPRVNVVSAGGGFLSSFHILDLRPDNGGVKNSLPEG